MMIDLLLSKPILDKNNDSDSTEPRIALLDELEKTIWKLMTSEGRSEARLWLCEAISCLSSIASHEQRNLIMMLLKSKPVKRDLAAQVLQMIFERRPHKVGSILAKKSHRLAKFFEGYPWRILQWFSAFSSSGGSAHEKGAKALSQFAFANRDVCWEELVWKGKHGQSPAIVATKPHYFLDLDVQRTVENFLDNMPDFWSSKEFSESLKDGDILAIDKRFFVKFFINLMYEDNLQEVWEVIDAFLIEEYFSYLCQHILVILDERDLFSLLQMLHDILTRRKEPVNFNDTSYWLEIVIQNCGDQVSIDQLFLLNALFTKRRQLLQLLHSDEANEEKEKIKELALRVWTDTSNANSLAPIATYHSKSKTIEMMKWLGLLSWTLLYRLSEECHSSESWKSLFVSNQIGFRKSGTYGLLEHDSATEDSEQESSGRASNKKKKRSRKRKKRNRHQDIFHDDEFLDLGGSDDSFSIQSSSTSWLLSIDGYSTSWSLADLPEHISKHCLREWMKRAFSD